MELSPLVDAVILGLVEGATEFIPVSSTGHLILFQNWLGFTGAKENAFIIFIQLGAILAVLWMYRRKFITVATTMHRNDSSRRLVTNLVIATIPAVIIGLPTEGWIEENLFRPQVVALVLVLGGIAILFIEKRFRTPSIEEVDDVPWRVALGIGMIQVLAILFPGLSRSGATIMGGLSLGLSRTAATEFSFFLAIPAMLGASIIKLAGVADVLTMDDVPVFAVGFLVAFVSALAVIRWLVAYVSRNTFTGFAWYRIAFGLVLLAFYWRTGSF